MRRPCPPRDPRSQDHTEIRITSAGLGGERLPQVFHLHKLFTSDPSPSPDPGKGGKEKSSMTFSSVPDGAISSGAHLGETAFHFKLCQAQKPEAQPSKKQELGEATFQRRGDGLGASPRLCWVSCLLPGGVSGPSQPHQPATREPKASGIRQFTQHPQVSCRTPRTAPSGLATALGLRQREWKFPDNTEVPISQNHSGLLVS